MDKTRTQRDKERGRCRDNPNPKYYLGNLVLKDFNIESEASGTGRPVVKTFNIIVTQQALKIQFNCAGKGTTGILRRGYYGPLVSAISVDPRICDRTYEMILRRGAKTMNSFHLYSNLIRTFTY